MITLDGNGEGVASGDLEVRGDRDVFRFSIVQSTSATISLTADNMAELDTFLRLYDSSGSRIAHHDDIDWPSNSNSQITRTLIPGTYYVSAASDLGMDQETGTYVLEVTVDPAAVQVPGDFDHDRDVDGDDFVIWQQNFGTAGPGGDANGDGQVDGDDFLIWQGNFRTGLDGAKQLVTGGSGPGGQASIVNGTVVPQSAYPTVGIVNNICSGYADLVSPCPDSGPLHYWRPGNFRHWMVWITRRSSRSTMGRRI